ncbi:response regulator [Variovorax ginsengisoli]|uniref:Response regulator n=1 Tax=Variovorax ginsengisoli TaxID=363844 RepID=A0ABT8SIG9_9BURK|nr:response regulator [Variovorax ginsengisoli]MDN8618792.1 response regulator [Variovorax ginsengisoli]MDO1537962.1 response regulator [Variovorax ginsengisoli]
MEDDVEVAALTREMLSELGFTIVHAASSTAALGALADARSIDIVLSDVMLPGVMGGLELAREIRRRRPELPIVLTTGNPEATSGAGSGEFAVLVKPYSLDELWQALSVGESSTRARGWRAGELS